MWCWKCNQWAAHILFSPMGPKADRSQAWLMLSRKCREMVELRVNEGKISLSTKRSEITGGNACLLSHTLCPLNCVLPTPLLSILLHTHQSQTETLLRHCPTNAPLSSTSGHNTAAFQFWNWRTTIGSKSLPAFKWSVQRLDRRVLCTVCVTWKTYLSKVKTYLLRWSLSYMIAFVSFSSFVSRPGLANIIAILQISKTSSL